jgi:L-ascorbate metabolism protein UlaG (beta-lactamase superfamily)
MKVTKHVHSCITLEEKGKTILIDPGNYSYEEKAISAEMIQKLGYLLITHEHNDHMHIPLVKEIAAKFPKAKIISSKSVAAILEKENVPVETAGDELVKVEQAKHERLIGLPSPENVMFTIAGRLTHPGDSHSFTKTAEILALPVQAPWGSFVAAMELAVKLKPKTVIPVHDWHWKEEARKMLYKRAEEYLAEHGIKFVGLETGQEAEL